MADVCSVFNRCRHCNNVCMSDYCSNACMWNMWKLRFKNTASPPSPPPDVVEAARRLEKLNYLMAFVPLADAGSVQTVCEWALSITESNKR